MDNHDDDLSAFEDDTPKDQHLLEPLLKLAGEALGLEQQIDDLEDLLKTKKGRANELKTKLLPDAMSELQLSAFTTPDGATIKIEDFVSGSLPKLPDLRDRAIQLIEDYGGSGIIKNELSILFEKSEHNIAADLAEDLREKGFDVNLEYSVHPMTLASFARERLRAGEELDAETLGLFLGRKAKYTLPGAKKRSKY